MRRDAQARRNALIEAASECFAERGYSVPLEEIAARAGVGRGTLYRNFKDREALAIAIFDADLDRAAEIASRDQPFRQCMIDMALAGARGTALFTRIASELVADTENSAALAILNTRLATTLEPLAARARARGEVRGNVDGEKLGLVLRMVSGLVYGREIDDSGSRDLTDALDIVIEGLHAEFSSK